ncbi:MAG: hypothetical protein KHW79_11085 [Clostridiales bacterium]|nr:hypothetical protein [Clostridiales bacterium]
MLKKILASVLSVIMMLHGMTALTIGSEQTGTPIKNSFADSESTVENEILLSTDFLDIIYQTDIAELLIRNRKNGHTLSSSATHNGMNYASEYVAKVVGSLFSISYTTEEFSGISETYLLNMAYTVQTQKNADSIELAFTFPELDMGFTLKLRAAENYLDITLPQDSIWENGTFFLCSVTPLPFLAAGQDTDDGYVFYPDGCGALYHFKNSPIGKASSTTWSIYSSEISVLSETTVNTERDWTKCSLPVFGIKRGSDAYLGIVTQGEENSTITLSPSGKLVNLSRISCDFRYRNSMTYANDEGEQVVSVNKQRTDGDRAVRYYFLSEENADYSAMAGAYRSYLLESRQLKNAVNTDNIPLSINLFMGIERQDTLIKQFLTMTTFSQAQTIVKNLYDSGVIAVDINLIGWSKGGFGKYASHMPADSRLGGNSGLLALQKSISESGYRLFGQENYLNVQGDNMPSGFSLRRDGIYLANGSLLTDKNGQRYLASSRYVADTLLPACLKKYEKVPEFGIQLEQIGSCVYQSSGSSPVSKGETIDHWQKVINEISATGRPVAATEGNAYIFSGVDRLYDIPTTDSGYLFTDESIPFLQLVLHGYLPYSAQPGNLSSDFTSEKLKWIEYGCMPHFEITWAKSNVLSKTDYRFLFTSRYQDWAKQINEIYQEFNARLSSIWSQEMTHHERLSSQLYKTTYADGTNVYINYGTSDASADGYIVPGKDYLLVSPTKS